MPFTQQEYTELKAAIARGVLSVQYQDRREVYRSLEDMLAIARQMEIDLGLKKSGMQVTMGVYDSNLKPGAGSGTPIDQF